MTYPCPHCQEVTFEHAIVSRMTIRTVSACPLCGGLVRKSGKALLRVAIISLLPIALVAAFAIPIISVVSPDFWSQGRGGWVYPAMMMLFLPTFILAQRLNRSTLLAKA